MFGITNAEATTFLPQEQLLGSGQQSVTEVQFKGAAVSITVRDGVDDGVPWNLVGSVLNHVPQHERLVVGQVTFVEFSLDAAGDFLKGVFAISPLNFLKMAASTTGHASANHAFPCALPVNQRIGRHE